jgi:hypothetical protein
MTPSTFRRALYTIAFGIGVGVSAPATAAVSYPSDPGLVSAINSCVVAEWPSVTIVAVTYAPPLASVRFAPGSADQYTIYFAQRPHSDQWQCITHVPSVALLGSAAATSVLQTNLQQTGITISSTQTSAFVQGRLGRTIHPYQTFSPTRPLGGGPPIATPPTNAVHVGPGLQPSAATNGAPSSVDQTPLLRDLCQRYLQAQHLGSLTVVQARVAATYATCQIVGVDGGASILMRYGSTHWSAMAMTQGAFSYQLLTIKYRVPPATAVQLGYPVH